MNEQVKIVAERVVERLLSRGYTIATAESCTGGSIAAAITGVPGCSAVFKGSVVAYCNEVKASVLGVSRETLSAHGAVSEDTVRQMALGVQSLLKADCAVATSGIAGPGGGTPEKPVGTVWVAVAVGDIVRTRLLKLSDSGRLRNIENSVSEAMLLLLEMVALR
ncbi:MAG: CinA family protein [Bacteroidaceae bacterium]|nr:CinA family protein [Bacteroidaceae bacterium]